MSEAAKVLDLDELTRFRAAVIKALDELRLALGEAESEVGRVRGWIERDQVLYWNGQKRKAQENVTVCKSALYRKQMVTSSKDQKPSVVDEKKALERAIARLDLCEKKMAITKRWSTQIGREEILFKAGLAPLSTCVERDLPQAVALLAKMLQHLESYVRLEAPDLVSLLGVEKARELVAEMRRTGDPAAAGDAEASARDDALAERVADGSAGDAASTQDADGGKETP